MEHSGSERILLTPSCMDSIVFDILSYCVKESAKKSLGETADVEEVIGENIEGGEVAASG